MTHEKIIKRNSGTQYKIVVAFHVSSYGKEPAKYRVDAWTKEKGKRKWQDLDDTLSDWEFRKLDLIARDEHKCKNMLRFVSEEEIYSAKLELWEKLKPKK
jgi:hypothetical protein